jgi:phospholipid transport system substrate-binding protein
MNIMKTAVSLVLTLSTSLAWAEGVETGINQTPIEVVQELNTAIIENMTKTQSAKEKYAAMEKHLSRVFDIEAMVTQAIGPFWKNLTDEQKAKAQGIFFDFMVKNYAEEFKPAQSVKIEIISSKEMEGGFWVTTNLITTQTVELNYVVKQIEGRWQIVNVYYLGSISQLAKLRSEYSSVLRSGFDNWYKLMKDHSRKIL